MDNNSIIDRDIIKDIAENIKKAEKELEIQKKAVKEWNKLDIKEVKKYAILETLFDKNPYIYAFNESLKETPFVLVSDEVLTEGNELPLAVEPYNEFYNLLREVFDEKDAVDILLKLQGNSRYKKGIFTDFINFYKLNKKPDDIETTFKRVLRIIQDKEKQEQLKAVLESIKANTELSENPRERAIQILQELEERLQHPLIYKNVKPVNIEYYKPEDYHDIQEIIDLGGFLGAKVDDYLKQVFLMLAFDIDNKDSDELIRYAPHTLIFTGTKRGKTTLARHLGLQAEGTNTTPARLLGFSTGNEVSEGLLNQVKSPVFIDELEQLKDNRELANGFLTLMEQGIAEINKGKQSLKTRYGNAITFLSNRKVEEQEQLQGKGLGFLELLQMINKNMEGLGSRIAVIIYNNNLETMKPQPAISKKKIQRAEAVFFELRKLLSQKLRELLESEKVRVWLEQEFDSEFKSRIEDIIEYFRQQNIEELATFWKSYLSSYRHFRGGVLRLTLWKPAVIKEILNETWKNEYNSFEDFILDKTSYSYDILKTLVLDAIDNLRNSDLWEQYGKLRYNELKDKIVSNLNQAERIILYCVLTDSLDTGNTNYTTISDQVKARYEDIKDYIIGSYGKKFALVSTRLSFEKKRDTLNDLGFKVIKRDSSEKYYSIIIEDLEKREQVLDILKEVLNLDNIESRVTKGNKQVTNKQNNNNNNYSSKNLNKGNKGNKGNKSNKDLQQQQKNQTNTKKYNSQQNPVTFVTSVTSVTLDKKEYTRTATNKQKNKRVTDVTHTPVIIEETDLTEPENPEPKQKPAKYPFNNNLVDDILFILEQDPLTLKAICKELQGKHDPIQVSHCIDYLLKVGDIMLIKDKKTGEYKYALKK